MTASVKQTFQLPFEDDSAIRRVHNESILLLGGGRALLMQIAHPAVARGVAEHSGFQKDRLRRLLRTLRPIYAIVFGTRAQAETAVASINHTHDYVNGDGYDAQDPELLLWVWATLVDTALVMHRLLVRALSDSEAAAYYKDMRQLGRLLGVPASRLPCDLAGFDAYVKLQVESMRVSDEGRRIALQIFRPWPPHWAIMWPMKQLTAGLLPPSLRSQYSLSWGPKRQHALDIAAAAIRRLLPLLPGRLRRPPAALLPQADRG